MGNNDTTTTTTTDSAGPSAKRLKKAVRAVLEEAKYSPKLTLGQIRTKVKERLAHKHPTYDFDSSPTWRKESKEMVARLIGEWEAAGGRPSSSEEGKKRPASGSAQAAEEEDEQEAKRRRKEEKAKQAAAEGRSGNTTPAASSSSTASVSSAASPSAGSASGDREVYKRLVRLAQAMRLAPAIFAGLKEMDPAAQTAELRARLKAKGAQFGGSIPSLEEIKKAEKESQLKKDLEGIESANIVEGGRRSAAAKKAPGAAAAPAAALPASPGKGQWEAANSGSEEEMRFE